MKQIEFGGQGKLYSYSKCFGKMLFKYANLKEQEDKKTVIEIRNNALVNCVYEKEKGYKSLQAYLYDNGKYEYDRVIPYFTIDMSNARADKVGNLKIWLDVFWGRQEYIKRYKDIYDPIGDAEVVSNYTGENNEMCSAVRYELTKESFCKIIYLYGLKYATEIGNCDLFHSYIQNSIDTIPDKNENLYYSFYKSVLDEKCMNDDTINEIFKRICWKTEKIYMSKEKAEKNSSGSKIANIYIYKADTSDKMSRIWKEIVLEAIRQKYIYTDCKNLK